MTTVQVGLDSKSNIARRYGHLFRLPSTRISLLLASLPIIGVELIARSSAGEDLSEIGLFAIATELALILGVGIDLYFLKAQRGLASFRRLSTVALVSNLIWFAVSLLGLFLYLATQDYG